MKIRFRRLVTSRRVLYSICVFATVFACLNARHKHNRYLAARNHYDTVRYGYLAVRAQRPADREWDVSWRDSWKWPSDLKMDRQSVWAALPLWEQSIRHAQLRDHYSNISSNPLLMFLSPPAQSKLLGMPLEDANIATWWAEKISPHVAYNGLSESWGTSNNTEMLERQCRFMDDSLDLPWYELRELMPVEDGWDDELEHIQLAVNAH